MRDGRWSTRAHGALLATVLVGCTAQESDRTGLHAGTYEVTGAERGTCADDTWTPSGTTIVSLELIAEPSGFSVNACTPRPGADPYCTPAVPSHYMWRDDAWRGEDGGAYLAGRTGAECLLVYATGTAHRDGDHVTLATMRWSADTTSAACTYDNARALQATPCVERMRVHAVEQ